MFNEYIIYCPCMRERGYWGDPDVDGRIILRWISGSWRGLWGLDGVSSG
jgi:hypothetical protein